MNSKLLVLDLDETLVYATEQALDYPHHSSVGKYLVYDRPHVGEFLDFCLKIVHSLVLIADCYLQQN